MSTAAHSFDDTISYEWDRLEEESIKAYEAFCAYRDMGSSRGVLKAYRLKTGKNEANTISGQWLGWYDKFDWKERARAYDVHLEKQARKVKEAEYQKKIQKFQESIGTLQDVALKAAVSVLQKGVEALNKLDTDKIEPQMIPAYLRAAAAVAESATNAQAQNLAITELMAVLEADSNGSEGVLDSGE